MAAHALDVPTEIWLFILNYLCREQLVKTSFVCRPFYNYVNAVRQKRIRKTKWAQADVTVIMGSHGYPCALTPRNLLIRDLTETTMLTFEGRLISFICQPLLVHKENPLPFLRSSLCPFLCQLDLKNITFPAGDFLYLQSLSESLEDLRVENLRLTSYANTKIILRNCLLETIRKLESLEKLSIKKCIAIDGNFLLTVAKECKKIRQMDFDDMGNVRMPDLHEYVREIKPRIINRSGVTLTGQQLIIPPQPSKPATLNYTTQIIARCLPFRGRILEINLLFSTRTHYRTFDKSFFTEWYPEEWEKMKELEVENFHATYLSDVFHKKLCFYYILK